MTSPLLNLTLMSTDELTLVNNAKAAIQTLLPGILLTEGTIEATLIEASALMTATVQYTLNRLPQTVTDNQVALQGLPRLAATAASGSVAVTLSSATIGIKVLPAGSRFRIYNADGSSLDLVTTVDTTMNPAAGSLFNATVTADRLGSFANTIPASTPCLLVDVLAWVGSAVTGTALTGGTEPETDDSFYRRAFAFFQKRNSSLVTVTDFQAAALGVAGVGRCFVISAWDGSAATPGTVGGAVAVAVATASGGVCSTPAKTAVSSTLLASCIAGLTPTVLDPHLIAFTATIAVHVAAGFVPADVIASVTRSVAAYLSPTSRGWGQAVYTNQLIVVAGEVNGVDRVISASGTAGGTDFGSYTPGPLDLPSGAATVTVTVA